MKESITKLIMKKGFEDGDRDEVDKRDNTWMKRMD